MALELNDGVYPARGVTAQLGESGNGTAQVGVQFRLTSEGFEGKYITAFLYFTEKTTDKTIEALRNCGWKGDDLSDLTGIDTEDVELVIANEEYTDKDGNKKVGPKVQWVNKPGGGGIAMKKAMAPDAAKAFGAKMKGAVLAWNKKQGQSKGAPRPAQGRPPEPPPHTDTDAPPF